MIAFGKDDSLRECDDLDERTKEEGRGKMDEGRWTKRGQKISNL